MQNVNVLLQNQLSTIEPLPILTKDKHYLIKVIKKRILMQNHIALNVQFNQFKYQTKLTFIKERNCQSKLKAIIIYLNKANVSSLKYHTLIRLSQRNKRNRHIIPKRKWNNEKIRKKLKSLINLYSIEANKLLSHFFKKYSLKAKIIRIKEFRNHSDVEMRSSYVPSSIGNNLHNNTKSESKVSQRHTIHHGLHSKKTLNILDEKVDNDSPLLSDDKAKRLYGIIIKHKLNPIKEIIKNNLHKFINKQIRRYTCSSIKDYFVLFSQSEYSIQKILIKKYKTKFVFFIKLSIVERLSTTNKIKYMSNLIQNNKRQSLLRNTIANAKSNPENNMSPYKKIRHRQFINLFWKPRMSLKYYIKVLYNNTLLYS